MSVGNDITTAFDVAMQTVPGQQSVTVEPPGDPSKFPALEIYEGDWTAIDSGLNYIRWRATWTVTGFVQGAGGSDAIADRHALHGAMVAVIMVDETLGGIVERVDLGDVRRRTALLANVRRLSIEQDFEVEFTTSRTNPALPG